MADSAKIAVPKIEVFPGRLRLWVRLSADAPRFVDETLAAKAYDKHPTLPVHSCINAKGPAFGDVAVGTSLPHLLEHLVIAEQVRLVSVDATFVGTTNWTDGGPTEGEAIVEVSFMDDLQAIEALRNALAFLNTAIE